MDVLNFKCPNCNAPLLFSGDDRSVMVCEYCENTFPVAVLEEYYKAQEAKDEVHSTFKEPESAEWMGEEYKDMLLYSCPSCGAQILGDAQMGATQCLYCGNPTVIPQQFSEALRPDIIIPFRLSKDDAVAALKRHIQGKRLIPTLFSDQHHIEEIKGLYVPVWLYDCDSSGVVNYNGKKLHTWSDTKYMYTRTDHYLLKREGTMNFYCVPVDGSSKMKDEFMESIEPFDASQAVPFSMAYLSGFYADKYDMAHADCQPRAEERVKSTLESAFSQTTSAFTSVTPQSTQLNVVGTRVQYALYPVWILSTRYEDQVYTFIMNGQTGRFAGDLPLDKGKMWKWYVGLTAGIGFGLAAGEFLLHLLGVLG